MTIEIGENLMHVIIGVVVFAWLAWCVWRAD